MFEKRKLKKFKSNLATQSDKNYIEQLYLNAPDYMKNDKEVCELLFNKNKSLLKILPIDFQIDMLTSTNLAILYASREAQTQFLKNNLSESSIETYISDVPEVITEYVLNNISILNNPAFSERSKHRLLDLIKEKDLLKNIINSTELSNNKELIQIMINKDNSLLREVSSEIKLEFIYSKIPEVQLDNFDYISLLQYLNEQEKQTMLFQIIAKKGDLIQTQELIMLIGSMNFETQKNIACQNLNYLKYCNQDVQLEMFNKDNKLIRYLDDNTKEIIVKSNPNLLHELRNTSKASTEFANSFEQLNSISYSDLNIDEIINSPVFSAKGSLLNVGSANGTYDMLFGINQYSKSQYKFYQNMPEQQLAQLCMHDVNYILPVAAIDNKEQIEYVKTKVKNVFGILYGQELLSKYSSTIDIILNNYFSKIGSITSGVAYDFKRDTECVLDLLKIVFNKEIIKNNDVDLISYYIHSNLNDIPNEKVFNQLITNAYGKNASDVLNSRPNLNEHNINSLEVFNPIILEKFGVGLVHDLLSYNISNMSYFLSIAKNPERLSNLSDLYQLESNIFGKNITTFQRTLNDFVHMESLLVNIGNKEMTEQELENLYSVIINRNYAKINTKEELINYENIVKLRLLNEIKDVEDVEYIKEKICNAIFGINYTSDNNYERLQMDASKCSALYECSNAYNSELLSKSEITMMDFLSVITHESSKENIINILNNLFDEQNILGNCDYATAITKMKENQEKLLNDNLINIEKLEKEAEKKSGLVIKTTRHGVPIYILNGIEYGALYHSIGGTNNDYISNITGEDTIKNIETFEEQYGSSTISTWYQSNNTQRHSYDSSSCCYIGYSKIPNGSIVGMDRNITSNDISTDHASKLVSSFTAGEINFNRMHENSHKNQEISFYRKLREQSLITNENHGGRFDFDYFFGEIYVEDLSSVDELALSLNADARGIELYTEAKKRKKPIILVNNYAYSKNNQNIQEADIERGMSL